MASDAYRQWVEAGRPLYPCRPVRDIVGRLRVAYPRAALLHLFSWYADEAHYQAEPPQDHTPFSATGWPVESPRWWVFAVDVMHRPDLDVDCVELKAYWLAEARAGRMPWLKYMIWQARRYDVRNSWLPVVASGHFDHIHLSVRTDHQFTSLDNWPLTPGGEDMPLSPEDLVKIWTHDLLNGPGEDAAYKVLNRAAADAAAAKAGVDRVLAILAAGVTPATLAAVSAAADAGAREGVHAELDAATVTTTIDTPDPSP